MAQTLTRSQPTRHRTFTNLLNPNRLLSTAPPPLLNHHSSSSSLTPLSQTLRSITYLLKPKPTSLQFLSQQQTLRHFRTSQTLRSTFRPLSPHLPVYQPQLSATTSILNRISSVILTVTVLGFYLLYVKCGSICFTNNGFYQFMFYSSKLNTLVLEISAVAMIYHVFASVRHLVDDFGNKKAALGALLLILSLTFLYATLPDSGSGSVSGSGFAATPTISKVAAPHFPGYWQIVMEKPGGENASKQEMIDCYVKTLAKVVGSEEEAKKKIYNVSCEKNFGFGCEIDEKTSNKLEGLPGVMIVRPDSYVDPEQKDYGAELFVNGEIVQRLPEKQKRV